MIFANDPLNPIQMQSSGNYNEEQRRAIIHGTGPVLVISGSGTGKTKLLVGRILHLVLEKNVPADSILALTFTEKAAQEMMERVDRDLPLGYTQMWIKTFHSFADSVLRERGLEIGLPTDYKILSEVDLWLFLKRHIFDFEFEYFRPLGNPQKFLTVIQEHFSRLKDEDISPEQYLQYAKKQESPERILELAKAYQKYEQLLLEENALDFGGLLYYCLRLFEKQKTVLEEYQKRFQYILVDEYQDTNFAQNKIMMMLADSHKNLLIVGDDDQSIYKWRGASLINIQAFEKKFPRAAKIVLTENYRSQQAILDLAHGVIQRNNPHRLEVTESIEKKLISRVPLKSKLPEIHHFPNISDEVDFIIQQSCNSLSHGNDPAILVRSNSLATHFLERLKSAKDKVAFQHFSPTSIILKPIVQQLVNLLRVIGNPHDDMSLFRFLSLPIFQIPMTEILNALRKSKYENRWLFDVIQGIPFQPAKKIIIDLTEFSREHTISEVLTKFLNESGYLKALTTDKKSPEFLEDISVFALKVKEFEERNIEKSVSDFLSFVSLLEYIPDRTPSQNPLDPHAVKIITIHSAKGLEFDCVFVPGLVQGKFPVAYRKEPFEIPPELIPEPLPTGDHHLNEERRLFYVASTRAKRELFLTYSDFYDGKKQWKPSIFVDEALSSGKAKLCGKAPKLIQKQPMLPLKSVSRPHRSLTLNLPKLSYSQLDTFRTCPLKYQFRYLFQVPVPLSFQLNFGSSIHNTLRDFYLQKGPFDKNTLCAMFEKNWIGFGYESKQHEQLMKERGREILEKFLEEEMEHFVIPAYIEKSFSLAFDSLKISGRIDRIDKLKDGTYEVIDYKTGENHEKNLDRDLQLSIYALACRDALKIPVSKLSLYFLESGEKVSTSRNDKDLDACKAEIFECAKELASSDFAATPGYHCRYCDFRSICPQAYPVLK